MPREKNVLTTGQVAKICNVAPRTVSKWFDSGQLRGYRIPGSKDRRIPLEQLVRFMRANGIPLNGLDTGCTRVLVVDDDESCSGALHDALGADARFEIHAAHGAFEAGLLAKEIQPHALVVDVAVPGMSPRDVTRSVRASAELSNTRLIAVGHDLSEAQGQGLVQEGFDGYLCRPFDLTALVGLIEEAAPEISSL